MSPQLGLWQRLQCKLSVQHTASIGACLRLRCVFEGLPLAPRVKFRTPFPCFSLSHVSYWDLVVSTLQEPLQTLQMATSAETFAPRVQKLSASMLHAPYAPSVSGPMLASPFYTGSLSIKIANKAVSTQDDNTAYVSPAAMATELAHAPGTEHVGGQSFVQGDGLNANNSPSTPPVCIIMRCFICCLVSQVYPVYHAVANRPAAIAAAVGCTFISWPRQPDLDAISAITHSRRSAHLTKPGPLH